MSAELGSLIAELLDNFTPFGSAWEADNPWSCDGLDLARRMRKAIGRAEDGSEDGEAGEPATLAEERDAT